MTTTASVRGVAFVATAAMTVSMLPLFVLGALGPVLVPAYGMAPSTLGILVAAGFLVASLLSVPGGELVDRVGPRRCLVGLFLLSGCGLALVAFAQGPWLAMAGVAVAGVPQALANPATNKAIIRCLPPDRRGSVLGLKQSGVQLGALVAGLPLAGSVGVIGWRAGVGLLAGGCFVLAVAAMRLLTADPHVTSSPASTPGGHPRLVWGLAGFSVALGFGVASVNTFLAVYASERIGLSAAASGTLVAVLGVAGIAGRIGWSRLAGRREDPARLLPVLAAGAVASTCIVVAAMTWGAGLLWLGAAGIGLFAVAANAVSMVVVVDGVPAGRAGKASAVVAGGFFAGFAVGPVVSGGLVSLGYAWAWSAVAVAFVVAGAVAVVVAGRRRERVASA